MKIRSILTTSKTAVAIGAATLFSFSACKDKPKPTDPPPPAEKPTTPVTPEEPVDVDPSGYNSGRTQAFGFLSRMPATTEGAVGIRNLSDVVGSFFKSNTFKKAALMMEQAGGFDPDSVEAVQEFIDAYIGKEIFVIMSQGTATQFENLQFASEMMNEMNLKAAGAQLAGGIGEDEMTAIQQTIRKGLKDENSRISKALVSLEVPPLIIGSKMQQGAGEELVEMLGAMEEEMPPFVTVSSFDAGGAKFKSWKVNLRDVFTEDAEAGLDEFLEDPATTARVAEIIREKEVELCFGILDGYLVFGLGKDHKHLEFVSEPSESILAASQFGFADQFLSKKLIAYSFMNQKLMKSAGSQPGQVQHMADSFADGLSVGGPAMKKLGGLIKKLGGQLEAMSKRGAQFYVGLNYMENGIHGESIGGYTNDLIDHKSKSIFANAAPADAAMVISGVANPEYNDKSIEMMETLAATVEAGVEAWAESSGDDSISEQFGGMKQMFGDNLSQIWGVMKGDFMDGLGNQSGLIVDLKGTMPKGIPNVPNVIINQGKVPRLASAADVKDRAKLAGAWKKLVPILNDTMKKIPGQEPGSEAQVPDVMSDDGDDLVTHYFSFPFFTNDFMPSISLNDDVFLMSTSKQFSQAIAARAKAGAGDIRGTYVMMNFKELHGFLEGWLTLVQQNADELFPDEFAAENFMETAAGIQMGLEFTRGIRGFKYNRYSEDSGKMRSSWHLHFEDIAE